MPIEGPRPVPRFLSREQLQMAYAWEAKSADQFVRGLAKIRLETLERYPVDTIGGEDSILQRENPL